MAEPAAMQPKKTISEIARPRARTQLGSAVWAETLRLVSTVIQPRPQRTAPGRAEAVLVASPSAAIAAATATVPAAARRFASAVGRIFGNETGRASCRDRVGPYVLNHVGAA